MKTVTAHVGTTLLLCLISTNSWAAGPDPAALAREARQVLQTHCYRCHGQDGKNEGGFNYVLDVAKLVGRRKVVPGEPGKSKLYRRVTSTDDPMPPEDEKSRPSPAEVAVLKHWIVAGAPDAAPRVARRSFVSAADMVAAIRDDLERQVPERDRRFARYFTLTHLYNAGLSGEGW
jgi:cytochrome c